MPTDALSLPATTASPAALAEYDQGVRAMCTMQDGALSALRAALDRDPGFALAQAGLAMHWYTERHFEEAQEAALAARRLVAGQSARERSHVEALALLVEGDPRAEQRMSAHLQTYPRDALVAQRLCFLWFWEGRFAEMEALTARLLPEIQDRSHLLGLHAFALGQCGRHADSRQEAEAALARDPRDPWSVHALAHVLHETGAFAAGTATLPRAIHRSQPTASFRSHLCWHLALMHLAAGDLSRASAVSRAVFERRGAEMPGALDDAIALLWRLQLRGQVAPDRWKIYAELARQALPRVRLHLFQAHLAMALAMGGDWSSADRQLKMLRARAPRDRSGRTGSLLLPLVEGLHAFVRCDDRAAIAQLEALRPQLGELGGTSEQLEVFDETLIAACLRSGDADRARRFAGDRRGGLDGWH